MASSLWAEVYGKGRKEGLEEGRAEGALLEARAFCMLLARQHHPRIADSVVPLIGACPSVVRLHEWGLQSTRVSDAEFERLLAEDVDSSPAGSRTGRRRTPRPSRRVKATRSR